MAIPIIAALVGAVATFTGIFPPARNYWNQMTNAAIPNDIPDVNTLIALRWKKIIPEAEYLNLMSRNGMSSSWATKLYYGNMLYLDAFDMISAWRRGIVSEEELTKELSVKGFTDDRIDILKQVSEYYPTPQDLVRFAVREVYTPATVAEYQMMSDLPPEFIAESKKAGLPEEQARNYWASHWELPSVQQGYEMLHRKVIDDKQLDGLMKALDIMPMWRDKLKQISYNVITRVDARRMYRLGIYDEVKLKQVYEQIGYSPNDADDLVKFTVKYESDTDNGVTRASVVSAYKREIIDEKQLRLYLGMLDYSEATVEFWVSMAKWENRQEELDEKADEMIARYRLGMFNIDTLRNKLLELLIPLSMVESLVAKEMVADSKKVKVPTKDDLTSWLSRGLLNEVEFGTRMRKLGYTQEDTVKYLQEFNIEEKEILPKYLSDTAYQRLFTAEIISEDYMREQLKLKGISKKDTDALVEEGMRKRFE